MLDPSCHPTSDCVDSKNLSYIKVTNVQISVTIILFFRFCFLHKKAGIKNLNIFLWFFIPECHDRIVNRVDQECSCFQIFEMRRCRGSFRLAHLFSLDRALAE